MEILAEGIGPSLNEAVRVAPRQVGPRDRANEPLPGRAAPRFAAPRRLDPLDERVAPRLPAPVVPKELAKDPVMAAIFADTARTTLLEQSRQVVPGDAAQNAAARIDPAAAFGEENLDRWNKAAFGAPARPGLPADFLSELTRGD